VTGADVAAGLSDKIKAAKMVSANHQVATFNLPGMPMSDTDEDISDSEPPLTASGGEGSVVHQYVTSAELAAQIAMWQDVGDTKNKFCASKLSLGNPSESDLREMLGLEAHILKSHYIVDI
jgi:hypothetical protein